MSKQVQPSIAEALRTASNSDSSRPAAVHEKTAVQDKLRVLIVDDNEDAANTLGRLLTLMGKEVRVVHSGPVAIAEVVRFSPQVVLLDLGMPGMDGIETANHIRARPAGREVALVALTGWGQEHDRQMTEEAGFTAHLVKPVNLEQLEVVLSRAARGIR
jgi:two-component system CheB/CheR fusion protein